MFDKKAKKSYKIIEEAKAINGGDDELYQPTQEEVQNVAIARGLHSARKVFEKTQDKYRAYEAFRYCVCRYFNSVCFSASGSTYNFLFDDDYWGEAVELFKREFEYKKTP